MSTDWTPIVNSFFGTLGVIVMGYFALLTARMKHNQEMEAIAQKKRDEEQRKRDEEAAAKVDAVKETLVVTRADTNSQFDGLQKVARSTHTFVNSGMGFQLKLNAMALQRVAELSKGLPGHEADVKMAEVAMEALAQHQKMQAEVDAQPGTDAEKKGEGAVATAKGIGQVVGETAKELKAAAKEVSEIHRATVKPDSGDK